MKAKTSSAARLRFLLQLPVRLFLGMAALLVVGCLTAFSALAATASNYPSRPIKLVVPFPPGGSSDIPARLIAKKLEDAWGQAVVVENRTGATGTIGESHVAHAKPDGYTLLVATSSSHTMGPYTIKKLSYDPVKDLAPVTLFAWVPHLIVAHPSVQAATVQELIAVARGRPGELNYSTSGNGSSVHLATEIFSRRAGIEMTQIPYRGVNPAALAVASGQVQLMFPPAVVALPHIESGSMRALATLTPERLPSLPEVPTMDEAGLAGYQFSTWLGLLAPAGTPEEIILALQTELARIMAEPEVRQTLAEMSFTPTATTPGEFGAIIQRETAEHKALIAGLGL